MERHNTKLHRPLSEGKTQYKVTQALVWGTDTIQSYIGPCLRERHNTKLHRPLSEGRHNTKLHRPLSEGRHNTKLHRLLSEGQTQ